MVRKITGNNSDLLFTEINIRLVDTMKIINILNIVKPSEPKNIPTKPIDENINNIIKNKILIFTIQMLFSGKLAK